MKGIRVSVKMVFKNPFFFEKEYKRSISKRLYELGIKRFTFSDLVCRRKKVIEEGFYAIDEARFDFTTIYFEGVYDAINKIAQEGIGFKFGRVLDIFVDVKRIEFFNECYLLSPVLVLDEEGRSVDFVENPVLYNKLMRDKIIKRYIDVFGKLPKNDSFIIIFRNTPAKIVEDEKIYIKSKCELYGSKELIYLANCIGIGDKNEEGFGMISEELYFYK
ncbi:CRISPR-associated endoribonuclease Cas6 [Thermobrachium celere]|uniref:CRISPR-associated endoribonuclease Cas6 n=1 Tax=Thermobrachium celere TaxID=53422 RepID=UPI00194539C3|nr:CRISPR-associated endoribonuclease Cas6 [Thermobrachium celere]GFR35130.1 hypothetical protein TCEA9_09420 [Thermobrachium celere]